MVVTACRARHSKRCRRVVDADGIEPVAGGVVGFIGTGSGGLSSTPRDGCILHDVGQDTVGGEPGRFRKRSRANLERLLTQPCPYCSGRGRIKSLTTICLNLRKELLNQRSRAGQTELLLRVHPEVARALQQEERAILDELQRSLGVHILLQSDPELHHERFDVVEV